MCGADGCLRASCPDHLFSGRCVIHVQEADQAEVIITLYRQAQLLENRIEEAGNRIEEAGKVLRGGED